LATWDLWGFAVEDDLETLWGIVGARIVNYMWLGFRMGEGRREDLWCMRKETFMGSLSL